MCIYIYMNIYVYVYIYIYVYFDIFTYVCNYMYVFIQIHRETNSFEGRVYLYHKTTPPPKLGDFWLIFEGWSQILPSTKMFCHGFEQSCSAMATQKLEEKVLQHDEDADLSKSGCNGLLQPALMCSCNGLLQAIEGTWHDKAHACTHV